MDYPLDKEDIDEIEAFLKSYHIKPLYPHGNPPTDNLYFINSKTPHFFAMKFLVDNGYAIKTETNQTGNFLELETDIEQILVDIKRKNKQIKVDKYHDFAQTLISVVIGSLIPPFIDFIKLIVGKIA